jgi:uncharacterized protein YlzI (FlbEa/FlbD family)
MIQLQRADREQKVGLYLNPEYIEAVTPNADDSTGGAIILMNSGDAWHVRYTVSEVLDELSAYNKEKRKSNSLNLT